MKIFVLLCSLLALAGFAPPKPKLNRVKLASGLSVGVPTNFAPLPDEAIAVKFPAPRKPVAVYSSPNGHADYSVSVRPTAFGQDYTVLLPIYKAGIQRLYTKVDFLTQEVRKVNGREFAMLEFISTLTDNRRNSLAAARKYEYIAYTVQGEQLYVFSFSSPADEQAQWRPVAAAVLGAVDLK